MTDAERIEQLETEIVALKLKLAIAEMQRRERDHSSILTISAIISSLPNKEFHITDEHRQSTNADFLHVEPHNDGLILRYIETPSNTKLH